MKIGIDTDMLLQVVHTAFVEWCAGAHMALGACVGIRDHEGSIVVYSCGSSGPIVSQEVEKYLATIETRYTEGSDCYSVGTPHRIVGVKVGESIIACYSNALPGIDESIAVVYGHYHELHQKMPVVDDLFSDTLLLHLGIWVKENQREGSRSLSLAKKVFKPELCI